MIGEKLKNLIGANGRKELDAISKEIGVTSGALYTAFRLDRIPSQKIIEYVHKKHPTINFSWWFFNEGEEFLNKSNNKNQQTTHKPDPNYNKIEIKEPPTDNVIFTDPEILALLEEEKILKEQIRNVLKQKVSQMRSQLYTFQTEVSNQGSTEALGKLSAYTEQTFFTDLGIYTKHRGVA